jgi:CHAT domain-containing protein
LLNGTAQAKPLPAAQKGPGSPIQIVIRGAGSNDGGGTGRTSDGASRGAGIIYIAENEAPLFTRDEKKPFAHPFYWAPFILIGNWK